MVRETSRDPHDTRRPGLPNAARVIAAAILAALALRTAGASPIQGPGMTAHAPLEARLARGLDAGEWAAGGERHAAPAPFDPSLAAPQSLSALMEEGTLEHPLQDDPRLLALDQLAIAWDHRDAGPKVRAAGMAGSLPREGRPGSFDLAAPGDLPDWAPEDLGGIRGFSSLELVVADLEGDGRPERVTAFQDSQAEGRIVLFAAGRDATGELRSRRIDTGLLLPTDGSFRMAAGHFLDPQRMQLVLAMTGPGFGDLGLHLLDPGGTPEGDPLVVRSLPERPDLGNPYSFDLAAGDLDGDALDEIALVRTLHRRMLELLLVDPDPATGTLRVAARNEDGMGEAVSLRSVAVVAGDFQQSGKDDLFVSYVRHFPGVEHYPYDNGVLSKLVRVDRDFGFHFGGYPLEHFPSESGALDLAAGDLNGDGRDEVAVSHPYRGSSAQVTLYEAVVDETGRYGMEYFGTSSKIFFQGEHGHQVVMADLDRDTQAEIAVLGTGRQGRKLWLYEVHPTNGLRGQPVHELAEDTGRIALAAGPLTGETLRLGTPRSYRETAVAQILAVINAPPSHYDVLDDGTEIRVNVCENPEEEVACDTRARYKVESEQSEISVDVHRSWSLSEDTREEVQPAATPEILDWIFERIEDRTTLPDNLEDPEVLRDFLTSQMGLGTIGTIQEVLALLDMLQAKNNVNGSHVADTLTKRYGRDFERREERIESIRISKEVRAGRDDVLIRSVTDYDVWEYPLLQDGAGAMPEDAGHLLVIWPHCDSGGVCEASTEEIVPGTSMDAGYAPEHEPLNILSYPSGPPANYLAHNRIARLDRLEVGGAASTQSLTTERIRSSSGSERRHQTLATMHEDQEGGEEGSINMELQAGVDLKIFTLGGAVGESKDYKRPYLRSSLRGEYGSERISTHELRIGERTTIELRAGALTWSGEGSPPPNAETRFPYVITPYVYWSAGLRALTLDYAAEPQLVEGNGWDRYYNRPDPAFNLPWKLGRESEALRQRSKEIRFDPPYPAAGAPVTVTARIHNYGLQDLEVPLEVGLYAPSDYAWSLDEAGSLEGLFVSPGRNPERVSSLALPGGQAHALLASGDGRQVLVANATGIRTVNTGRPDAPVIDLIQRYESPAPVGALALDEGRLYAALGPQGVAILGLPLGGEALGTGAASGQHGLPPASARGLAAGRCYDSAGRLPRCLLVTQSLAEGGGALLVLDVDEPADPRPMSFLPLPAAARRVVLARGHAFVAAEDGLHVIDMTLADNPRAVGFLPTAAPVEDLALFEGLAYLAAGPAGLLVADISSPRLPLLVGGAQDGRHLRGLAVAPSGDRLVATGPAGSLRYRLDEDPSRPRVDGLVGGASASLALAVDAPIWHEGSPQRIHAEPLILDGLPARGRAQVRVPWTAPSLGISRLYARIDPDLTLPRRGVREVQRGNNLAYAELRSCPAGPAGFRCRGELPEPGTVIPPDLALAKPLPGPAERPAGSPVPLSVEVLALAGDHENLEVNFHAGDPDQGGTRIGSATLASLTVGGRARAHLTWEAPDTEPGTVAIWAVVEATAGERALTDNRLRFDLRFVEPGEAPVATPTSSASTATPVAPASATPRSEPTQPGATATAPPTASEPVPSATPSGGAMEQAVYLPIAWRR